MGIDVARYFMGEVVWRNLLELEYSFVGGKWRDKRRDWFRGEMKNSVGK